MFMAVILLALAAGIAVAVGHVILRPLDRAARGSKRPIQFMLTDFIWLLIQLQIALGVVVANVEHDPLWVFAMILGFLAFAVIAMWCGGVHVLSRLGIRGIWRRAALIVFLLPGALVVMMGASALCVSASVALLLLFQRVGGTRLFLGSREIAIGVLIFVAAGAVTGLACWVLRLVMRWILAEKRAPDGQAAVLP
jgi:hypothetical protein